jgi:5-(carboxyamino)imidazole ribonucleotide synthase
MTPIAPGATIGILGSGQLGRMLGMAAAQIGYRIHVYAPEPGPACDIASAFTPGDYDDVDRLTAFAASCDVVTYEFENVPVAPLIGIADKVRPGLRSLEIAQARDEEKAFVRTLGGRTARYAMVADREGLTRAFDEIGAPAILKTVRMGYDGKGQARIASAADLDSAWQSVRGQLSVLEGFVTFTQEFSILVARGPDGRVAGYPAPVNVHRDGILHRSTVPASLGTQAEEAAALAHKVAEALDHVGVLALEFFATAAGPVFNEMAPRVHNSGHWTIEGAETSQFENHIRAICGLPLGSTALTGARVEMENLIGADAEGWPALMAEQGVHLHLYGKHDIRPGRKMGHVTRLGR